MGIFTLKQDGNSTGLGCGRVNSGQIPLVGCVISGRFLRFLEPCGLVNKMGIETPLRHRTVHRVTINNHTMAHAIQESIPGHVSHEVSPRATMLSHSPLLVSRPHMPQQLWEDKPSSPIGQERAWAPGCSSCALWTHRQDSTCVGPLDFALTACAVSTQLTCISLGPACPCSTQSLTQSTTPRGHAQVYP